MLVQRLGCSWSKTRQNMMNLQTLFPDFMPCLSSHCRGKRGTSKGDQRRVNIILRHDQANLGLIGEEIPVRPGYARNFLIPERIAVYATDDNRQKYLIVRDEESEEVKQSTYVENYVQILSQTKIVFTTHPYGSDGEFLTPITASKIIQKLEKQHLFFGLSEMQIIMPETPLKSGDNWVTIDLSTSPLLAKGIGIDYTSSFSEDEAGDASKIKICVRVEGGQTFQKADKIKSNDANMHDTNMDDDNLDDVFDSLFSSPAVDEDAK